MVTRVQILNKVVYISHCSYSFGKGQESNYGERELVSIGKTRPFNLDMAISQGERKQFKPKLSWEEKTLCHILFVKSD